MALTPLVPQRPSYAQVVDKAVERWGKLVGGCVQPVELSPYRAGYPHRRAGYPQVNLQVTHRGIPALSRIKAFNPQFPHPLRLLRPVLDDGI